MLRPDASHIRDIHVVSNTHWDREFRRTFEKTRRRLLTMMDVTLDALLADPDFPSFTMDGHCIMIDDYLEMRPERADQVHRLIREGRLLIGPWYTLPETMSIGHEALARNFLWGRRRMEAHGQAPLTVAYTPASWGQTGQLPQILSNFGLRRVMFYRGISHHECPAEFLWESPDGTRLFASRFALYARYNWYYQVHRPATRGRVFSKDYTWGEFDDAPLRFADGLAGEDLAFDLKDPETPYNPGALPQAVRDMVQREGPHFTTPVFLAMHGHDISVAYPMEGRMVRDAAAALEGVYTIRHTDLEHYWDTLEQHLDPDTMTVLRGERRQHLREGMWTYLFPASISARVPLKVLDDAATRALVYTAEPLAALASACAAEPYPRRYVDRGWAFLLENHTHDANGGCAPDAVCRDIEYRYCKALDVADIVTEDAMAAVARRLSPEGQPSDVVQLVAYNPLPVERDVVTLVDVEMPRGDQPVHAVALHAPADPNPPRQPVDDEKSSAFVDNIWDVPTILDSARVRFHAHLRALPPLGYRVYTLRPEADPLRNPATLVTGPDTMQNNHVRVTVNGNGTVTIFDLASGMIYEDLNYLRDQGEAGNAWRHVAPLRDRVYTSLGVSASVSVVESGPLVSRIMAEYTFPVPGDYADGQSRSTRLIDLPVCVVYTLRAHSPLVEVRLHLENTALDHWLRACFPTGLQTDVSVADSHFDAVERDIPPPDSTGWVEKFEGTHPLRSFVTLNDGHQGLAVYTKGLFEYEALPDAPRTLALSLLRACRIKLAVSEEKQTELPDRGVQCPGPHSFSYAIHPYQGGWHEAGIPTAAADWANPLRLAQAGRGKGTLPHEASLLALHNRDVHIAAVKQAEDGDGLVVRLFNPTAHEQHAPLQIGVPVDAVEHVRMDESPLGKLDLDGSTLPLAIPPHKIVTLRLRTKGTNA